MSEYRTPLPGVLAGTLEAAINRLLALDEGSARRLQHLQGKRVRLELEGLGIVLHFSFTPLRVDVSLDAEGEPDTMVKGSPAALFAMAIPDEAGQWGMPGSRVKISGDATLARDLERLFSNLDPNWEGQLSNVFGEVAGYQLAAGARGAAAALRETLSTLEAMTSEFFQRPGSPLAQENEIRNFGNSVDGLRDAAERLEARLRLIRERRANKTGFTPANPGDTDS